ncbi:MAG: ATP-binding response regulator, partial [Vicinamibacteria bacterium]
MRPRFRRGDIGAFVKGLASECEGVAQRQKIELRVEVGPLPEIYFDPDQMDRVLLNLLMNSLKFTAPTGSVRVSVEDEGEFVHLRVADTGVGVTEADVERVFDRFAQVDASAARRYEGTGLGLALSRELVELHRGRIWCESEEGRGTKMHVLLPTGDGHVPEEDRGRRVGGDAEERCYRRDLGAFEAEMGGRSLCDGALKARTNGVHGISGNGAVVLIVEDNADMRGLLIDILGRRYRVLAAGGAREALRLIRQGEVDLVLADVMMPEMTGYELCAAIKGDPAKASIPVVLITARAESGGRMEGYGKGADDYVVKPFDAQELTARVGALLRLRGLQKELSERNRELQRLNREVELYARAVSHDVRGPLSIAWEALRRWSRLSPKG